MSTTTWVVDICTFAKGLGRRRVDRTLRKPAKSPNPPPLLTERHSRGGVWKAADSNGSSTRVVEVDVDGWVPSEVSLGRRGE